MKDKKVMVLVVLSIGAVISLIYGIVTPSKSRRGASSFSPVIPAGQSAAAGKVSYAVRRQRRTTYTSWGRSPFVVLSAEDSGQLKLKGILWDSDYPKAIINEEILQVGDSIGEARIISIMPDSVIVNDGHRTFELRLE